MIIQFFLGAILLLLIVSVLFVMHFLSANKRLTSKSQATSNQKRNQLNRALYDVRMQEIESDDAQGLVIDKDKIVSELQHNLLDDINDEKIKPVNTKNKLLWLPGLLLLVVGTISVYWSVGAYQEVNDWENTLQRYPALQDKLFNDENSRPTEAELRDIMLGLRTHLATEPKDADGWLLYSRLGMVFRDADLALDAIKKAYLLKPNSVDILLVYAQLKMQKGDEYSQQQAESMLAQLLKNNPEAIQAWSMYAFMALEREDYTAAIERWEKMLVLVGPESEQAGMLHDSIEYAKKQITSQEAVTAHVADESVEQPLTTDEAGNAIYNINISVADNVILPESGFVIVYAQAVSGPKMPIAAVKLAMKSFPLTTQLSDANVMIEGFKLSDQSEFVVKARLSKNGDVMQKSGDWQGSSVVIKKDQTTPIDIIITDKL